MTPGEEETGFQIYLRQIAKFPLLTAEQEVELGRVESSLGTSKPARIWSVQI